VSEFLRFAVVGLGVGAIYVLVAQGLVVIYRGSGVLNLAIGAIGLSGAYVFADLTTSQGWATVPALVVGVMVSALLGLVCQAVVMRLLRHAAPLARVVATLGILIIIQSIVVLKYGGRVTYVPSFLPVKTFDVGSVAISVDRVILISLALVLSVLLWFVYHRSLFGLATAAAAESERAAAAIGWSPNLIATSNWVIGSALAGLAGILIAPITTLQVSSMTTLLLVALAAALLASFNSFPVLVVAGLGIGAIQSVLGLYVTTPGVPSAVPFVAIVVTLMLRGTSLPLRDVFLQRLPAVGSGRIRPALVVPAVALAVVLIAIASLDWVTAIRISAATTIFLLSVVVLTGYAGQLSLAQAAFGGVGALVAGRVIASAGAPVLVAAAAGVLAATLVGLLFSLPAVRTRGITLAVVTLGLGDVLQSLVFNSGTLTGGLYGTVIGEINAWGWSFDAIGHPRRYATVVVVLCVLCMIVVANLRRGSTGRRFLAIRTNERAAAALGINVGLAKAAAFGWAAALAAVGGIATAFSNTTVIYSTGFDPIASIQLVGWAFIGGVGFVFGPVLGSTLAPGGLGTSITDLLPAGVSEYLPLVGGILIVLLVVANQDGIVRETISQLSWIWSKLRRGAAKPAARRGAEATHEDAASDDVVEVPASAVVPRSLEIKDLQVAFGATKVLRGISLRVEPGEIVGLIGPNGAGKTTVVDAISGFVKPSSGDILVDGEPITQLSAAERSRAGVRRSFQSLELFEDSTVAENIQVATDGADVLPYLTDALYPRRKAFAPEVKSLIREFRLTDDLDAEAQTLPFGKRHLLSVARSVASFPSVLLLDEPAAGLGEAESRELVDVVRGFAKSQGMAVLLIEHDMGFVSSLCDRVVVLNFGTVIFEGDIEQMRQDPDVVAAYLGAEQPRPDDSVTASSVPTSTVEVPR
jgi:ABC-type branched-subunit amino acid transport system ATPase component/ABC-type branched-subunit amino acid transport system permease subunit